MIEVARGEISQLLGSDDQQGPANRIYFCRISIKGAINKLEQPGCKPGIIADNRARGPSWNFGDYLTVSLILE